MALQNPTRASNVIITHPNRDKPVVRSTRVAVVLLLLISAALITVVTVGGWKVIEGAAPLEIGYVIVYLTLAFYAARWKRGVLPVASSLAVLLAIFALVSGTSWFERDKAGFTQPDLNSGLLGTLTFLVIPVQILLIAFAMRGFQQGWNVEVEQRRDTPSEYGGLSSNPA